AAESNGQGGAQAQADAIADAGPHPYRMTAATANAISRLSTSDQRCALGLMGRAMSLLPIVMGVTPRTSGVALPLRCPHQIRVKGFDREQVVASACVVSAGRPSRHRHL